MSNEQYTARKKRTKVIRVIVQAIILAAIGFVCANAIFTLKAYQAYSPESTKLSEDKGFVALSYFGVEKRGKKGLITSRRLEEHLKALKNSGYVTVSQKDILDYYQQGKKLPEKSLFLIFEDGRKDTAVFSQAILENLNFKATMLTYPENFAKKDPGFLTPNDLKGLEKTSFWEMGTNGFRLFFINVFDRHGNYLGEMDPLKHAAVAPYLGRKYNHYLMDYIRDEYGVPKESPNGMKERISYDYEALRDAYTKSLGYVPQMYILMHSNTGSFGNNDRVSAVNAWWIKELFKMNFNREGFCFNERKSDIYDLTRMQPQAYWHTNHLLMRIKHAAGEELEFVKGDLNKQKAWETIEGAAEIQDEMLILTSLPKGKGLMRLKNSNDFADLKLSVRLKGNKVGLQKIYLRAGDGLNRYLSVYVLNNFLYAAEKNGGQEKELFKLNLDKHDGLMNISVAEDKKAAEIRALEASLKYAPSLERAKVYAEQLKNKNLENAPKIGEGSKEYLPLISIHERGDRLLELALKKDRISIMVDGKVAVNDLEVTVTQSGALYLESAWGGWGFSRRNLADSVYDGVFEKLLITENTGAKEEKILFDAGLQGFEGLLFKARELWRTLIEKT